MCDENEFPDFAGNGGKWLASLPSDTIDRFHMADISNHERLEIIKAACALGATAKHDTLQDRILMLFDLYMAGRKDESKV